MRVRVPHDDGAVGALGQQRVAQPLDAVHIIAVHLLGGVERVLDRGHWEGQSAHDRVVVTALYCLRHSHTLQVPYLDATSAY